MKHDFRPQIIDYLRSLYAKSNKFNLKTKFIYKKILDQMTKQTAPILELSDLSVKFLGQKTKMMIQENVFGATKNPTLDIAELPTKCDLLQDEPTIRNENVVEEGDLASTLKRYDLPQDEPAARNKNDTERVNSVGPSNLGGDGLFVLNNLECSKTKSINSDTKVHKDVNMTVGMKNLRKKVQLNKNSKVKDYKVDLADENKHNEDNLVDDAFCDVNKVENKDDDAVQNKTIILKSNKPKTKKRYIPKYKSGAFAILRVLCKEDGLTKKTICNRANKYSNFEFNLTERFSAWNSIKTLINKDLVFVEDKKYYLTNLGTETCENLNFAKSTEKNVAINQNNTKLVKNVNKSLFSKLRCEDAAFHDLNTNDCDDSTTRIVGNDFNRLNTGSQDLKNEGSMFLYVNNTIDETSLLNNTDITTNSEFKKNEINLIIDSREMKSKKDRTFFQRNLDGCTQNLELGDFLWIKNEKVLNYIIERKKGSDFVSSISDGRFNEQKKRLIESGITNIFYIVENLREKDCKNIGYRFIRSCLLATKYEGFIVLETCDIKETVETIKIIDSFIRENDKLKSFSHDIESMVLCEDTDKLLETRVDSKTTSINVQSEIIKNDFAMSYDDFAEKGKKTIAVTSGDILYRAFASISGVSHIKAEFLTEKFGTLQNFYTEAAKSDFTEKLSNEHVDGSKFGKKLAHKILDMLL